MNKQLRYLILAVLAGIIGGLILPEMIDNFILRTIIIGVIVFIIASTLERFKPQEEKKQQKLL